MRKRILMTILCAIMIATMITGCGSSSKGSSSKTETSKKETVSVEKEDTKDYTDKEEPKEEDIETGVETEIEEKKETVDMETEFDINEALGEKKKEEAEIDDIEYTIYENGAVITGIKSENAVIKSEVEYEGEKYFVVGLEAIYFKTEEFEIPDFIKYVFPLDAASLKTLTIPDTVEYFCGTSKYLDSHAPLESVTFPEGIKTDKRWYSTFNQKTQLKSIVIPEGVEELSSTFRDCDSLEEVVFPESIKHISGAFCSCKSLKSINLPEGVEEIRSDAFAGTAITSLSIPLSVRTFDLQSVYNCDLLEELIIPDTVEEIYYGMIKGCDNLKKIVLPKNVELKELNITDCPNVDLVVLSENTKISFSGEKPSNCTIQASAEMVDAIKEKYPDYNVIVRE